MLENVVCEMLSISFRPHCVNTLRPRQNGRHFADAVFKRIFFNENVWISIKISLKFVPKGPINKIPALFQIMAWRRPGDKSLSEAVLVSLLTHKCVARPQWVEACIAILAKRIHIHPFTIGAIFTNFDNDYIAFTYHLRGWWDLAGKSQS